MGAGKFGVVNCTPPLSLWPELRLPTLATVQRLLGLDMPALTSLTCDNQPLNSLPWNDLKTLIKLNATASGLTALDLWRLPNLQSCIAASCLSLTQVDAHGSANLTELNVQSSPLLSAINIASCPKLKYIYASNCAFSSTVVSQLFNNLLNNGVTGGRLEIAGAGNAAPPAILRSVLVSMGWTIVSN